MRPLPSGMVGANKLIMKRSFQKPRAPGFGRGGVTGWAAYTALGALSIGMLVACGDSEEAGALGELGAGTFDYRCENSGDLKCSETNAVDEFELGADLGGGDALPQAVAVGATFGIRYAGSASDDGDAGLVTVDSVSADDKRGPNVYSIEQPAQAAFTATDSEGNVVDFAVLTALEATEIGIWHDQDELRDITIDVGETVRLTVAPRSESGTFLAGALPYDWQVIDDSVAAISELNGDPEDQVRNEGDVELLGVAEGTTFVRVRSGDLEAVVEVEVTP